MSILQKTLLKNEDTKVVAYIQQTLFFWIFTLHNEWVMRYTYSSITISFIFSHDTENDTVSVLTGFSSQSSKCGDWKFMKPICVSYCCAVLSSSPFLPWTRVVAQLKHVRIILSQNGDCVTLLPDHQPCLLFICIAKVDSIKLEKAVIC